MPKAVTTYGNFVKGRLDHDMMGRFDLPIYTTGADVFKNFISNYKGNAIFSAGFLSKIAFQDCAFIEFKFGGTQNYLTVWYASKIRFLAFDPSTGAFGWVLNGSSTPLEVTSPYTLADAKTIAQANSYTQNSDVMVLAHRSYAPYKLTRTASNVFTMATFTRTNDPFTGAGDYPGCVLFYKGRLYYASTNNKPTTIWFSNSGLYDDFTIQSPLTDASGFNFALADITQRIEWLFPGDNSLIVGSTDGLVAVNGGTVNTAITAATVQANITSAEPTNGSYPLKKQGLIFYIGRASRQIYYFKYDILTEAFQSQDANLAAYDITLGGLSKLRYKHDRNDLIFGLRGDGALTSLVFQEAERINGWHERTTYGTFKDVAVMADNNANPQFFALALRNGTYYIEQQASYVEFAKQADFWTPPSARGNPQDEFQDMDIEAYNRYISDQMRGCVFLDNANTLQDYHTSTITFTPDGGTDPETGEPTGTLVDGGSSFASGDVGKHIVYKTATGYESGRFVITAYTSTSTVSVSVLQTPKQKFDVALNSWSSWYRSFSSVSGFSQYIGQNVGVVTDGGFLDSVAITDGTITFPNQITSLVVGYQYTGIIKSMCLGFQFQQYNTQTTLKNIVRAGFRCVASMGLRFGSTLYDLQDVQERTQSDLNYLPPLPIDGTKYVDYTDDSEEDKFFYIVQDQPLPAVVANFMLEANYASSS